MTPLELAARLLPLADRWAKAHADYSRQPSVAGWKEYEEARHAIKGAVEAQPEAIIAICKAVIDSDRNARYRSWIDNNLRRLVALHRAESYSASEFYESVKRQLALLDAAIEKERG